MATLNNVVTDNKNKDNGNGETKVVGSITEDSKLVFTPTNFRAIGKVTRISNAELARLIKQQFQQTFHDLVGVMIAPPQQGTLFNVVFRFEDVKDAVPEGKIKNLVNLINPQQGTKTNFFAKQEIINNKISGKTYDLSDETKLLLSDFMFGGRNVNKPGSKVWKLGTPGCVVNEIHQSLSRDPRYNWGTQRIYVTVGGLDLRTILRAIYGNSMVVGTDKNDDNSIVNYNAKALYDAQMGKFNPDGTYMINVQQFDKDAVAEIVQRENPQYVYDSGMFF